ncbi:MAG: Ig-like domain-containing protein, partial [Eubacteriales bacterium]|nr:Ig-like domain-containing protein [Eubacteriales bacterium]
MKKWFAFVLTIALLFTVNGFAAAEETAVTLTPAADSIFLSVDAATTVKVTVAPYAARKKGVTYAVSDESVATISSKGRLTAVAEGQCSVTVTSVYDPSVSIS